MKKKAEPAMISADPWGDLASIDWGDNEIVQELNEKQAKGAQESLSKRRSTECLVRLDTNIYRRAFSETQLLDVLGFNFKEGESYHCITAGDVDSLAGGSPYSETTRRSSPGPGKNSPLSWRLPRISIQTRGRKMAVSLSAARSTNFIKNIMIISSALISSARRMYE